MTTVNLNVAFTAPKCGTFEMSSVVLGARDVELVCVLCCPVDLCHSVCALVTNLNVFCCTLFFYLSSDFGDHHNHHTILSSFRILFQNGFTMTWEENILFRIWRRGIFVGY